MNLISFQYRGKSKLSLSFLLCRDNHCVTPLLAAASRGHVDVVRHLLHHGGNDRLFNLDGHTPLHLAEGKGHSQTAQLLRTWRAHYLPYRKDVLLCREQLMREHPELRDSVNRLRHVSGHDNGIGEDYGVSETHSIPSATMKQSVSGLSSAADSLRRESFNRFRGSLDSGSRRNVEGGSLHVTTGSMNATAHESPER